MSKHPDNAFCILNSHRFVHYHLNHLLLLMRFVLAILFSLVSIFSYGQYDTILHKTFIEKRPFLSDFYRKTLKIHDLDFTGKQAIIEGMRKFGEQHKDESLVTEAALAKAWLQLIESEDKKLQTGLMEEFIASCMKKKDYISAARAYRALAEQYWRIDEKLSACI